VRTGRPRLTDGTKKASTFSVCLTADERGAVELAAERGREPVGVGAAGTARERARER
jgi:hypothetical protein